MIKTLSLTLASFSSSVKFIGVVINIIILFSSYYSSISAQDITTCPGGEILRQNEKLVAGAGANQPFLIDLLSRTGCNKIIIENCWGAGLKFGKFVDNAEIIIKNFTCTAIQDVAKCISIGDNTGIYIGNSFTIEDVTFNALITGATAPVSVTALEFNSEQTQVKKLKIRNIRMTGEFERSDGDPIVSLRAVMFQREVNQKFEGGSVQQQVDDARSEEFIIDGVSIGNCNKIHANTIEVLRINNALPGFQDIISNVTISNVVIENVADEILGDDAAMFSLMAVSFGGPFVVAGITVPEAATTSFTIQNSGIRNINKITHANQQTDIQAVRILNQVKSNFITIHSCFISNVRVSPTETGTVTVDRIIVVKVQPNNQLQEITRLHDDFLSAFEVRNITMSQVTVDAHTGINSGSTHALLFEFGGSKIINYNTVNFEDFLAEHVNFNAPQSWAYLIQLNSLVTAPFTGFLTGKEQLSVLNIRAHYVRLLSRETNTLFASFMTSSLATNIPQRYRFQVFRGIAAEHLSVESSDRSARAFAVHYQFVPVTSSSFPSSIFSVTDITMKHLSISRQDNDVDETGIAAFVCDDDDAASRTDTFTHYSFSNILIENATMANSYSSTTGTPPSLHFFGVYFKGPVVARDNVPSQPSFAVYNVTMNRVFLVPNDLSSTNTPGKVRFACVYLNPPPKKFERYSFKDLTMNEVGLDQNSIPPSISLSEAANKCYFSIFEIHALFIEQEQLGDESVKAKVIVKNCFITNALALSRVAIDTEDDKLYIVPVRFRTVPKALSFEIENINVEDARTLAEDDETLIGAVVVQKPESREDNFEAGTANSETPFFIVKNISVVNVHAESQKSSAIVMGYYDWYRKPKQQWHSFIFDGVLLKNTITESVESSATTTGVQCRSSFQGSNKPGSIFQVSNLRLINVTHDEYDSSPDSTVLTGFHLFGGSQLRLYQHFLFENISMSNGIRLYRRITSTRAVLFPRLICNEHEFRGLSGADPASTALDFRQSSLTVRNLLLSDLEVQGGSNQLRFVIQLFYVKGIVQFINTILIENGSAVNLGKVVVDEVAKLRPIEFDGDVVGIDGVGIASDLKTTNVMPFSCTFTVRNIVVSGAEIDSTKVDDDSYFQAQIINFNNDLRQFSGVEFDGLIFRDMVIRIFVKPKEHLFIQNVWFNKASSGTPSSFRTSFPQNITFVAKNFVMDSITVIAAPGVNHEIIAENIRFSSPLENFVNVTFDNLSITNCYFNGMGNVDDKKADFRDEGSYSRSGRAVNIFFDKQQVIGRDTAIANGNKNRYPDFSFYSAFTVANCNVENVTLFYAQRILISNFLRLPVRAQHSTEVPQADLKLFANYFFHNLTIRKLNLSSLSSIRVRSILTTTKTLSRIETLDTGRSEDIPFMNTVFSIRNCLVSDLIIDLNNDGNALTMDEEVSVIVSIYPSEGFIHRISYVFLDNLTIEDVNVASYSGDTDARGVIVSTVEFTGRTTETDAKECVSYSTSETTRMVSPDSNGAQHIFNNNQSGLTYFQFSNIMTRNIIVGRVPSYQQYSLKLRNRFYFHNFLFENITVENIQVEEVWTSKATFFDKSGAFMCAIQLSEIYGSVDGEDAIFSSPPNEDAKRLHNTSLTITNVKFQKSIRLRTADGSGHDPMIRVIYSFDSCQAHSMSQIAFSNIVVDDVRIESDDRDSPMFFSVFHAPSFSSKSFAAFGTGSRYRMNQLQDQLQNEYDQELTNNNNNNNNNNNQYQKYADVYQWSSFIIKNISVSNIITFSPAAAADICVIDFGTVSLYGYRTILLSHITLQHVNCLHDDPNKQRALVDGDKEPACFAGVYRHGKDTKKAAIDMDWPDYLRVSNYVQSQLTAATIVNEETDNDTNNNNNNNNNSSSSSSSEGNYYYYPTIPAASFRISHLRVENISLKSASVGAINFAPITLSVSGIEDYLHFVIESISCQNVNLYSEYSVIAAETIAVTASGSSTARPASMIKSEFTSEAKRERTARLFGTMLVAKKSNTVGSSSSSEMSFFASLFGAFVVRNITFKNFNFTSGRNITDRSGQNPFVVEVIKLVVLMSARFWPQNIFEDIRIQDFNFEAKPTIAMKSFMHFRVIRSVQIQPSSSDIAPLFTVQDRETFFNDVVDFMKSSSVASSSSVSLPQSQEELNFPFFGETTKFISVDNLHVSVTKVDGQTTLDSRECTIWLYHVEWNDVSLEQLDVSHLSLTRSSLHSQNNENTDIDQVFQTALLYFRCVNFRADSRTWNPTLSISDISAKDLHISATSSPNANPSSGSTLDGFHRLHMIEFFATEPKRYNLVIRGVSVQNCTIEGATGENVIVGVKTTGILEGGTNATTGKVSQNFFIRDFVFRDIQLGPSPSPNNCSMNLYGVFFSQSPVLFQLLSISNIKIIGSFAVLSNATAFNQNNNLHYEGFSTLVSMPLDTARMKNVLFDQLSTNFSENSRVVTDDAVTPKFVFSLVVIRKPSTSRSTAAQINGENATITISESSFDFSPSSSPASAALSFCRGSPSLCSILRIDNHSELFSQSDFTDIVFKSNDLPSPLATSLLTIDESSIANQKIRITLEDNFLASDPILAETYPNSASTIIQTSFSSSSSSSSFQKQQNQNRSLQDSRWTVKCNRWLNAFQRELLRDLRMETSRFTNVGRVELACDGTKSKSVSLSPSRENLTQSASSSLSDSPFSSSFSSSFNYTPSMARSETTSSSRETLSSSFTITPPGPKRRLVADAISGVLSATTTALTGLAGGNVAMNSRKISAVVGLADCGKEEIGEDDIPEVEPDSNPLFIKFGSRRLASHRGSIIGAWAFLVAWTLLMLFFAWARTRIQYGCSMRKALRKIGFPGNLAVPMFTLFPVAANSAASMAMKWKSTSYVDEENKAADLSLVIFGFVTGVVIPMILICWIVYHVVKHERLVLPQREKDKTKFSQVGDDEVEEDGDDDDEEDEAESSLRRAFDYIAQPRFEYKKTKFSESYGSFFNFCRRPTFIIANYFIVVAIEMSEGASSLCPKDDRTCCLTGLYTSLILCVLDFIVTAAYVVPFLVRIELVGLSTCVLLNLVMSILVTHMFHTDDQRDWNGNRLVDYTDTLMLLAEIGFIIALVVGFVGCLAELDAAVVETLEGWRAGARKKQHEEKKTEKFNLKMLKEQEFQEHLLQKEQKKAMEKQQQEKALSEKKRIWQKRKQRSGGKYVDENDRQELLQQHEMMQEMTSASDMNKKMKLIMGQAMKSASSASPTGKTTKDDIPESSRKKSATANKQKGTTNRSRTKSAKKTPPEKSTSSTSSPAKGNGSNNNNNNNNNKKETSKTKTVRKRRVVRPSSSDPML